MFCSCKSGRNTYADDVVVTPFLELEPLINWQLALAPEAKEDKSISDVHVLLALRLPESEEDNLKPHIEGGVIFEYLSSNNCGLLNFLVVPKKHWATNMMESLVEKAVDILNQNARARGNLAGC